MFIIRSMIICKLVYNIISKRINSSTYNIFISLDYILRIQRYGHILMLYALSN